jgi:pimeloyl-ACP methyl ester carboxylesterase
MGDPVFDAYYASTVQFLSSATVQQKTVQAAGADLLSKIGKKVILLAHSQGGIMPWVIADAKPELVQSIVAIEPSGPPFHEAIFSATAGRAYGLADIPLTYSPPVTNASTDLVKANVPAAQSQEGFTNCTIQAANPPPRQLANLKKIPTVVVTSESSYHRPYDWCTVKYLKQAGVKTTHLKLWEQGIKGNGHMMFLEKNSDVVASAVRKWIEDVGS